MIGYEIMLPDETWSDLSFTKYCNSCYRIAEWGEKGKYDEYECTPSNKHMRLHCECGQVFQSLHLK
jgi:hypothetical protein